MCQEERLKAGPEPRTARAELPERGAALRKRGETKTGKYTHPHVYAFHSDKKSILIMNAWRAS